MLECGTREVVLEEAWAYDAMRGWFYSCFMRWRRGMSVLGCGSRQE